MARIAGVNIPTAKRIEVALTYIFGIGKKTAQDIAQIWNRLQSPRSRIV